MVLQYQPGNSNCGVVKGILVIMRQSKLSLLLVTFGLTFALATCSPKATPVVEATLTSIPRSPTPAPAAESPTEHSFNAPPISHPLTTTLGNQIELLGYDLSTEVIARPWYNARRWSSGLPTLIGSAA